MVSVVALLLSMLLLQVPTRLLVLLLLRGGGGEDAGIDRDEVGDEREDHLAISGEAEFLLDFREVTMFRQPVGTHAFMALAKQQT